MPRIGRGSTLLASLSDIASDVVLKRHVIRNVFVLHLRLFKKNIVLASTRLF
jgi:hypothetical protein